MSALSRSKKRQTKRWETIDVPAIDELEQMTESQVADTALADDFCVRFFCHDMRFLYTVASRYVKLTRGVLDYLHDYNQLGPNKTRNRLFLCSQYNKDKVCLNGPCCREVHCTLSIDEAQDASVYGVPSNATGAPNCTKVTDGREIRDRELNKNVKQGTGAQAAASKNDDIDEVIQSAFDAISVSDISGIDESTPLHTIATPLSLLELDEPTPVVAPSLLIHIPEGLILRHSLHSRWTSRAMYATLPSGVQFNVALPNTSTPIDTYDSSQVFITLGAQDYYDQCMRGEPGAVTMQHCAHYSKNGVCCFGKDCQFVHVLHYRVRERGDVETSCSDFECSSSTTSACTERRVGGRQRHGQGAKETPLCIQVPGAGRAGHNGKPGGNADSRSSSVGGCSSSMQAGITSSSTTPASTHNGNTVLVPLSVPWPQQQQQQQPPSSSPSHSYNSAVNAHQVSAFGVPNKPMMYPGSAAPSVFSTQPPSSPYVVMQGQNGEFFIVPNVNAQSSQMSSPQLPQSPYVLPFPFK